MEPLAFYRCATGLSTYIYGLDGLKRVFKPKTSGGNTSPEKYYAVWMRHLVHAHEVGHDTNPAVVAEWGPGDSLGSGIAALLTGATRYYGFDVVRYQDPERDVSFLDQLLSMFERREPIPEQLGPYLLKPRLSSYEFPHHILDDRRLQESLDPARIATIRSLLAEPCEQGRDGIVLDYAVPWRAYAERLESTVDVVFSNAVMEHVDNLPEAYEAMFRVLKSGGLMSHRIDYRSHNLSTAENGQWQYNDLVWKMIIGKRPYLLNRQPHGVHIQTIKLAGFEVLREWREECDDGIGRDRLARRFQGISDEDLRTRTAIVQATKRV